MHRYTSLNKDSSKTLKFLVIRFSSAGDIILTTPAIASIKTTFPDATLDFLTKTTFAPLLSINPFIDNILTINKGESLINLVKRLNKNDYHFIIDLHNSLRSNLLKLLMPEAKKITTKKRSLERNLLVYFKIRPLKPMSVPLLHLTALKELGVEPETMSLRPQLFLTQEEKARAIELGSNLIAMDSRSKWRNKRWGLKRFVELASAFSKEGYKVVIFSEEDMKVDENITLVKLADWRQLMIYIYASRLVITNDTVSSHIASAFGIPLVVLFGPTSPDLGFAPSGENVSIIHKGLFCSPCNLHGGNLCLLGRRCMSTITVEEVFGSGKEMLAKGCLRR